VERPRRKQPTIVDIEATFELLQKLAIASKKKTLEFRKAEGNDLRTAIPRMHAVPIVAKINRRAIDTLPVWRCANENCRVFELTIHGI
jgi:hypothetical protein